MRAGAKLLCSEDCSVSFTLGRALGLGTEEIAHGSQLYMDGVAVFCRVLAARELKQLSFNLG